MTTKQNYTHNSSPYFNSRHYFNSKQKHSYKKKKGARFRKKKNKKSVKKGLLFTGLALSTILGFSSHKVIDYINSKIEYLSNSSNNIQVVDQTFTRYYKENLKQDDLSKLFSHETKTNDEQESEMINDHKELYHDYTTINSSNLENELINDEYSLSREKYSNKDNEYENLIQDMENKFGNILQKYSKKDLGEIYEKIKYYETYLKDYLDDINTLEYVILQTIGNFNVIKKYSKKYEVPLNVSIGVFLLENSGNRKALSETGNAGLWQLSEYLARHYGLRVDKYVDERFISEKATDAGIHYLKDLYNRFGRWDLAILGYHQGEVKVAKMIIDYIKHHYNTSYEVSDVWFDLIDDYNITLKKILDDDFIVNKYFDDNYKLNGKNYVWKVLAMEEIFLDYVKYHPQFTTTKYVVKRIKPEDTLYDLLRRINRTYKTNITIQDVVDHNPWIKNINILPVNYLLYIPIGKKITKFDYRNFNIFERFQ